MIRQDLVPGRVSQPGDGSQGDWIEAPEGDGWVRERGGKHQAKMVKTGNRPITRDGHLRFVQARAFAAS